MVDSHYCTAKANTALQTNCHPIINTLKDISSAFSPVRLSWQARPGPCGHSARFLPGCAVAFLHASPVGMH